MSDFWRKWDESFSWKSNFPKKCILIFWAKTSSFLDKCVIKWSKILVETNLPVLCIYKKRNWDIDNEFLKNSFLHLTNNVVISLMSFFIRKCEDTFFLWNWIYKNKCILIFCANTSSLLDKCTISWRKFFLKNNQPLNDLFITATTGSLIMN